MLPGLSFPRPERAPRSAEEAIQFAQALLRDLALEGASATLLQPAHKTDGFSGARFEIVLPEKALETALRKALEQKAREEGAQLKSVQLTLTPVHSRAVHIDAQVTATLLLSTVCVSVGGELFAENPHTLGLRHLRADCGRGMFATMASALLTPKIRTLEGQSIPLRDFIQRDVQVETLEILPETGPRRLRLLLSAERTAEGDPPNNPLNLP